MNRGNLRLRGWVIVRVWHEGGQGHGGCGEAQELRGDRRDRVVAGPEEQQQLRPRPLGQGASPPHPAGPGLQPQHNCASDPKPQLRFFRGQPHTAAALRVQGGNGGLPVPPHHFVLGDASPFVFELGHHADWSRIVWCAHFGDDTVNFTGTGQGGAIAAVFDIALTMAATSFFQQAPEAEGGKPDAYCVTVSLQTT